MKNEDLRKLESIMRSRFFTTHTASIYGGMSGFIDMGPVLTTIKQNFISEWRKHFVMVDNLLEIDTSLLLPYPVLKASGHVDKFCDILLCDEVCDMSYRADHYITHVLKNKKQTPEIEEVIKKVDCMTCKEIDDTVQKYNIKSPDNNSFKPSVKFNLMFETEVSCKEGQSMFLRPETAQGQFLNFKKLYEFNNKKMPFGSASIGKAFRNEISPRGGLIRTREFEQAEIEYFVSPNHKSTNKFCSVENLVVPLCFDDKEVSMTLKDAVQGLIIDNEVLAYFMGRTYLFLQKMGINMSELRFRQHKKDEMAHYAKDCWDVELRCSMGWVECVGIADRSAYDLTCHSDASGVSLTYSEMLQTPVTTTEMRPVVDKSKWIKKLKNKYENFKNALEMLTGQEIGEMMKANEKCIDFLYDGEVYKVECAEVSTTVYDHKIVPDVIEPSFGIGRILYVLLEHSFYIRDCGRPVLRIPRRLAYKKCVISCVVNDEKYKKDIIHLVDKFTMMGISVDVNDRSCSIGKKYASCDEIGIPYFVTFDSETMSDKKVTIRERDSMEQVRVGLDGVVQIIDDLINDRVLWDEIMTNKRL